MEFRTHTGEIISGEKLLKAQETVANFWADNAKAIRKEDKYASHVTEEQKESNLQKQLAQAERIRSGIEPMGFWLWQRINTELTGECVGFLPGGKPKVDYPAPGSVKVISDKPKHAPTPSYRDSNPLISLPLQLKEANSVIPIIDSTGKTICSVKFGPNDLDYAQFIKRACNSHEKLLEALEGFIEAFGPYKTYDFYDEVAKAKAALSLAKEGK